MPKLVSLFFTISGQIGWNIPYLYVVDKDAVPSELMLLFWQDLDASLGFSKKNDRVIQIFEELVVEGKAVDAGPLNATIGCVIPPNNVVANCFIRQFTP